MLLTSNRLVLGGSLVFEFQTTSLERGQLWCLREQNPYANQSREIQTKPSVFSKQASVLRKRRKQESDRYGKVIETTTNSAADIRKRRQRSSESYANQIKRASSSSTKKRLRQVKKSNSDNYRLQIESLAKQSKDFRQARKRNNASYRRQIENLMNKCKSLREKNSRLRESLRRWDIVPIKDNILILLGPVSPVYKVLITKEIL